METIFKARTSVEEGLFIDGKLISPRWTEFVSDSLYQSCLKDPSIEKEIIKEFRLGSACLHSNSYWNWVNSTLFY